MALAEPLPLEPYAVSRDGGSFLVLDPQEGTTLAAAIAKGPAVAAKSNPSPKTN